MVITIVITIVVIIIITWVQHHASKTAILIMCYPMKQYFTQMKVQEN